MDWQSIETAPGDGSSVLLYIPDASDHFGYSWPGLTGKFVVGHCSEHGEWFDKSTPVGEPTHWMPLPEPPEEEEDWRSEAIHLGI